jgi:hypothetical protein
MAAINVTEAAAGDVVIGEEEGGEGAVGSVLREELVDDAKNIFQAIVRDGALAAQIGLQVGHEQRGGDAFAGNVADDEAEAVGAEVEKVVIIAADGARGITVTGIVERLNWRADLRKKTALNFVGDFEFLDGATVEFEFCGSGAALGFEGVGDFVEADEGERVAVGIAEARGDAAPDGGFFAEQRGLDGAAGCVGVVRIELDATEARGVLEADAAFGPFLVFCKDVFGDEG